MSTVQIRPAEARGATREVWLDSRHTFSFGKYHDPQQMGFRRLRVINEDWIAPASGFDLHPHRDMEILTFVLGGELEHRDSLGERVVLLRAGDVQRMSAGRGLVHSELNPSRDRPCHFLQIWIRPETLSLEPSYEHRAFGEGWQRVASRDGREGSLVVHQDVNVYRGVFRVPHRQTLCLGPGRHAWIHVISGELEVAGTRLTSGSGVGLESPGRFDVASGAVTQYLVFDLD